MLSTGLIVILIALGIANLICLFWMIFELLGKNKCEKGESIFCPSYSCEATDSQCGIQPFRIENGKKVCQEYLTQSVLPKYT